jgi:DNA-binding LytR/AlgR family response regulator
MLDDLRVLLLEDEPLIAMELAEIISAAGGAIAASVRTAQEALGAFDKTNIDVAILDVHLRTGTSIEVAEALAELEIPFVFCTGDGQDQRHAANWPDVPVIVKPYSAGLVVETLSKLMRNRNQQHPGTA